MKKGSRRKNKKNRGLFLVVLSILFVGIGFAALQKYLTIDGTASINSNFDVRFNGIETIDVIGGAYNKSEPTFTNTTATFDAAFLAPGDSISYKILVRNTGTMNAKLENMDVNIENSENIDYEITGIESGDIIESFAYSEWGTGDMGNEEHLTQKVVNLKLTYTGSSAEITTSNVKITMKFVQTNEQTNEQANSISLIENEKPVVSYGLSRVFSKTYQDSLSLTQYQIYSDWKSEYLVELGTYVLGVEVYKLSYDDVWEKVKNATDATGIVSNNALLKLRYAYAINGVNYYSQYSDEFELSYVEENGFIYEANDLNTIIATNDSFFTDNVITLPIGKKIRPAGITSKNITKVIIPENYNLSDLNTGSLPAIKMAGYTLETIVNKTGNTIDWAPILGYGSMYNSETHSPLECQFEIGLCWDVNIVATE